MYNDITFDHEAELIAVVVIKDEYMNEIETETKRTILCHEGEVTRSEWYSGLSHNLSPSLVIVINKIEYRGEKYLNYEGQKYSIMRTFPVENQRLEITCERTN